MNLPHGAAVSVAWRGLARNPIAGARLAARPEPVRQRTRTSSVRASESRIVLVKGR